MKKFKVKDVTLRFKTKEGEVVILPVKDLTITNKDDSFKQEYLQPFIPKKRKEKK